MSDCFSFRQKPSMLKEIDCSDAAYLAITQRCFGKPIRERSMEGMVCRRLNSL